VNYICRALHENLMKIKIELTTDEIQKPAFRQDLVQAGMKLIHYMPSTQEGLRFVTSLAREIMQALSRAEDGRDECCTTCKHSEFHAPVCFICKHGGGRDYERAPDLLT